jgi:hypothetical protein
VISSARCCGLPLARVFSSASFWPSTCSLSLVQEG